MGKTAAEGGRRRHSRESAMSHELGEPVEGGLLEPGGVISDENEHVESELAAHDQTVAEN